jgi:hypothetical protein
VLEATNDDCCVMILEVVVDWNIDPFYGHRYNNDYPSRLSSGRFRFWDTIRTTTEGTDCS